MEEESKRARAVHLMGVSPLPIRARGASARQAWGKRQRGGRLMGERRCWKLVRDGKDVV